MCHWNWCFASCSHIFLNDITLVPITQNNAAIYTWTYVYYAYCSLGNTIKQNLSLMTPFPIVIVSNTMWNIGFTYYTCTQASKSNKDLEQD